jgi:hypothetical protein
MYKYSNTTTLPSAPGKCDGCFDKCIDRVKLQYFELFRDPLRVGEWRGIPASMLVISLMCTRLHVHLPAVKACT